jgi:hypothetical protein
MDHDHEPETSPALTRNKAAIHQGHFEDIFTFGHCSYVIINV